MKKILPTLLITTSFALCILAAFQWVQGAKQWERIDTQDREIFEREKSLQSFTNQVAIMGTHIGEMERKIDEMSGTISTNQQQIYQLNRDLNKSEMQRTNLLLKLEQYQNAFEVATNNLALAYDSIKEQNEAIKEAVTQRDDFVARLNESIKERNEIVRQYNELVEQVKKQQGAAPAPANNKPGNPQK
jgi:chromosome segregation ATPase